MGSGPWPVGSRIGTCGPHNGNEHPKVSHQRIGTAQSRVHATQLESLDSMVEPRDSCITTASQPVLLDDRQVAAHHWPPSAQSSRAWHHPCLATQPLASSFPLHIELTPLDMHKMLWCQPQCRFSAIANCWKLWYTTHYIKHEVAPNRGRRIDQGTEVGQASCPLVSSDTPFGRGPLAAGSRPDGTGRRAGR